MGFEVVGKQCDCALNWRPGHSDQITESFSLIEREDLCGLGHADACERAAGLAERDEGRPKRKAKPAAAAPAPPPEKPRKAPRRPRPAEPDGDPGERIYGS
jgi:hypothetical protein